MTKRHCEECDEVLEQHEIVESLSSLGALLCINCLDEAEERAHSDTQRRTAPTPSRHPDNPSESGR